MFYSSNLVQYSNVHKICLLINLNLNIYSHTVNSDYYAEGQCVGFKEIYPRLQALTWVGNRTPDLLICGPPTNWAIFIYLFSFFLHFSSSYGLISKCLRLYNIKRSNIHISPYWLYTNSSNANFCYSLLFNFPISKVTFFLCPYSLFNLVSFPPTYPKQS